MSDDTTKLAVLERESVHQTKSLDRIEATLKEQRSDADKKLEAMLVQVKGWIDHETGNRKAVLEPLAAKVELKADKADLAALQTAWEKDLLANQEESDDRFKDVKDWIDNKADKSVSEDVKEIKGDIKKGVWIVISAVITAVLVLVINPVERVKDFNHRNDTPAAIHTPIAPTTQAR